MSERFFRGDPIRVNLSGLGNRSQTECGRVKVVGAIAQAKACGSGLFVFLATDTRTPYTADYTGTDANKTAHYMLRWINTRGEKGPWSETASATIGA